MTVNQKSYFYIVKNIAYILGLGVLLVMCEPDPQEPTPDDPTPNEPTPYAFNLPAYFPQLQQPDSNIATEEGVALGRELFYEKKLSGDNTLSCGGCHFAESGFADPRQFSPGIDGTVGDRNSMAIINLAFQDKLFWDGRDNSLEEQALEPVTNPIEMHEEWPDAIAKIANDPKYPPMFEAAFGDDEVTVARVAKAIAQFERTVISSNSKYDRFIRGEVSFTPSELRGLDLFNTEVGDCFHCHGDFATGFQFTDGLFHNNGLDSTFTDMGLYNVTGNPNDMAKFKTPTLRNIEYTAPYMHDGRFQTLEEVIEHYNMGGHISATIDPLMKAAGSGRNWTEQQKQDLLNFLLTLSDPDFISNPDFQDPNP